MGHANEYDAIVLGVGAAGSAATYHLARRGTSVLGIDQFGVPNNRGSSRGFTRVINPAVREKPQYVQIIQRSLELWNELQERHPNQLICKTGALRGWTGPDYEGHRDSLEEAVELCESQGLPYEVLAGEEVERRFPGYDLSGDFRFLYQPDGGVLDVPECTIAHMNAAHDHGAEIRAHERVESWEPTDAGVRVRTTRGEYEAGKLLVTAGPWLSEVVSDLGDVTPRRAVMGWFRPEEPERFRQDTFPSFGWDTENGYFYGTPAYRIDGVKVGGATDFESETTVDPDGMDREVTREEEGMLRQFMEEHMPTAAGPTLRLTACMTTRAPDKQYVFDRYGEGSDVYVAGGFSGSGFMTASAVGEVGSKLVLGEATDVDLEPFRASRLSSAGPGVS
jgi:sarcosine oxidase